MNLFKYHYVVPGGWCPLALGTVMGPPMVLCAATKPGTVLLITDTVRTQVGMLSAGNIAVCRMKRTSVTSVQICWTARGTGILRRGTGFRMR